MTTEKSFYMISLDSIIKNAFDSTEEDTQSFVSVNEKDIIKQLRAYTQQAAGQPNKDISSIIEENAGRLLDSVCASNIAYFKVGMQSGALLLLQLLF